MRVQVVCSQRYNPHELWTALGVIRTRDIQFQLASTKLIIEDEKTRRKHRINQLVDSDLYHSAETCDGLMVVSGDKKDTEDYWSNRHMRRTVLAFEEASKPISAICCAVPTIRYAAAGKKVSYFPVIAARSLLTDAGAILQTIAVTRDQNLVTAEHQMATDVWAEEFCNLLQGLPQEHFFHDSGFVPRGRERKPIPELERLKELRNGRAGIEHQRSAQHRSGTPSVPDTREV